VSDSDDSDDDDDDDGPAPTDAELLEKVTRTHPPAEQCFAVLHRGGFFFVSVDSPLHARAHLSSLAVGTCIVWFYPLTLL
jgi:hypothetical protein